MRQLPGGLGGIFVAVLGETPEFGHVTALDGGQRFSCRQAYLLVLTTSASSSSSTQNNVRDSPDISRLVTNSPHSTSTICTPALSN